MDARARQQADVSQRRVVALREIWLDIIAIADGVGA